MRLKLREMMLHAAVRLLKALDRRQPELKNLNPEMIRSVLVVSSTAIGDTLMSTPAIRSVRERFPLARIVAHFNRKNMELFENNPHIDGVIPYWGGYRKFFRTVAELRRQKFDLGLILHGNEPQATPMAYLSGARFIIKIPVPKEFGFLLSNTTDGFDDPWSHHAIDVRMKAAALAGCEENDHDMVLVVDDSDRENATACLQGMGIGENDIIIGMQAGAATPYKMWPAEKFIDLGKRLIRLNPDIRVVLTGSPAEKKLCESVARSIGDRAYSVAGRIPLRTLRGIIERISLLVTNDTGTMHMAIALKTRTVSLFCPTNDWGVGPIQDRKLHKIIKKGRPCSPCESKKCNEPHCMDLITVEEVFEVARLSIDEELERMSISK